MNKEKFLKELEKKLKILSDSEKEDIINEYRDIIEEKVKHGKKEEEAVKEFGDINKLADEILSAYKINPDYNKNEENNKKDFVSDCENLIKEGAKKLTEVTDEVVESFKKSNFELTTENVFEIIIKVILVLIGLAILKLPFYIVSEIGIGIFNIGFSPFSTIGSFVWKVLVEIIYIVVCILIVVTFISKYTKSSTSKSEEKKDNKKENIKKEEKNNSKKKQQTEDTLGNFLLVLCKIFVIFVLLIPIWMIIVGLIISIAVVIYFLVKGISIYGILILLLGVTGIFIMLSEIIYNLLFRNKKICLWPMLINFILIILGSIMTFDYLINLEYHNNLPNNISSEIIKYEEIINKHTIINDIDEIIIDNNLEDNHVILEVGYYNEYVEINKEIYNSDSENYISFHTYNNNGQITSLKQINRLVVGNLKDNKIYNYALLDEVNIKIYTNEKTRELIEND